MRCGNKLIQQGDSTVTVQASCGPPASVEQSFTKDNDKDAPRVWPLARYSLVEGKNLPQLPVDCCRRHEAPQSPDELCL